MKKVLRKKKDKDKIRTVTAQNHHVAVPLLDLNPKYLAKSLKISSS